MARVSSTPGKTREINFFDVAAGLDAAGLGQLRIGAGRRGELTVRVLLGGYHADAQFRQACEHPAHRPVARAVKR